MSRFNKIIGIFGKRGTGKTVFTVGDSKLKVLGLINLYLKKHIKVLIIDTIDHPAYRHIPTMPMEKLKFWKSGVYRVIIKSEDIAKLNYILNSSLSIWNTALIYEDCRKHTFKTIDKSFAEILGDSKQKNNDIIVMYHNFGECPNDLFRKLDYIQCFKTMDSPYCRKAAMPGFYDNAMNIYEQVKKNKNPFYSELIDTGNE